MDDICQVDQTIYEENVLETKNMLKKKKHTTHVYIWYSGDQYLALRKILF